MTSSTANIPFVLEVPAFASVYIEALTATGVALGSATGFVVMDRAHNHYLVTNRHVVTGRHWETNELGDDGLTPAALRASFNTSGESGYTQEILPLGDDELKPLWLEHPQFGRLVDVVALPLTFDVAERGIDLVTYPLEMDHARLDLAGELFAIGYPLNVNPDVAGGLFGVWSRGTIAWPPQLDWRGLPCLLLDCRTRQGQSGSPVIFWADATRTFVGPHQRVQSGPPSAPLWNLVGVYSGRIHKDSDIGMVWKRSALEEIINGGVRPTKPIVDELVGPNRLP
ncbi:trypsin-like peptidase domain-containing protein [Kitasatospora cineracea]|uniref:trypsin-like peptidase domain-containing protein n=1 Tax=Kitasatospora cineracea TaxID=88074 RepID=UPI0033C4547B